MKIPINETRIFLSGELGNGVKYVVVEDNKIDTSAVSVVVKVGSFNDPKEFQGLAHFLEHMLFMGSDKYPEENYFEQKIKSNGGISNAYTDKFETVYYFNVISNLEEMVDIFSRFFIDPRFDIDSVNREINAVHSEHVKNMNNNIWRLRQVIYNISKKDSQINSFSTGNLETLNKKGVRDSMIQFYYNYYCSNNISISIISPIKAKKLQEFVVKYFSLVPKKTCPKLVLNKPFYNNQKIAYHIIPSGIKDMLVYLWEIDPTIGAFLDTHTWSTISEIIASDEKGGLQSFLIDQGLIRSLSSSVFEEGMFILLIQLINSDVNTKIKVNQYVKYFLKNIHKLNWKRIILGYQTKRQIMFDYGNRMDSSELVEMLSLNLHYYPLSKVYSGSLLINKVDPGELLKQLKYLDMNKSIQLHVNNNSFKLIYIKDKYYGTKYTKSKWINTDIKRFDINIEMDNLYYKIKPKQYGDLNKYEIPKIISNRLWYGATSKFKESGVFAFLTFSSNKYFDTPKTNLLTNLSCNILNFLIERDFNKATELGYTTHFISHESLSTINIYISGLNDMFNFYINEILTYLNELELELEDNVVNSHLDQMKKGLININKLIPWKYVKILLNEMIFKYTYSNKILLKELEKITIKDIANHIKSLFIGGLTTFFYGNIPLNKLPKLDLFQLNYKIDIVAIPTINLPKSKSYIHPNKEEQTNLVQYMYPLGVFNPSNIIKKILLEFIINEPFYNELRTKEQLGYLVNTYSTKFGEYYYFIQKIQSEKQCSYICEKIEQFNQTFLKDLKQMDNKKWNKWKKTVQNFLLEKESNTKELFDKHLPEIMYRKYLFNRNELLLNKLTQVKLKDIINYFYKKIINTNKIIIQIKSQIK